MAYAPGLAGVYQLDVTIPDDWPAGVSILDCGLPDFRLGYADVPIGVR